MLANFIPHRLIVLLGDIYEQHPQLINNIVIVFILRAIPKDWILRPLLEMFGFGAAGPVKGTSPFDRASSPLLTATLSDSAAAAAQRLWFGAAVEKGNWFSQLQSVGMKGLAKL
jgi:hypothetical protein